MADHYRLLRVSITGDEALAVVPVSNLCGTPEADDFRADLLKLSNCQARRVRLDAGEVTSIDGVFMGAVIKLWKSLQGRAVDFSLIISAEIGEFMTMTKLDKLFPVTIVPVADTPLIVYAPAGD